MKKNQREEKLRIYAALRDNPAWLETLREAVDLQKDQKEKYRQEHDRDWLGFEWFEVHAQPAVLKQMVTCRILDVTMSSRSSTFYKVRDPELLAKVLEMVESGRFEGKTESQELVPADLFSTIISHENVKWILSQALHSKRPVHVLLHGPPATAKTLFLADLTRLADSKYILGSTVSKAGLTEYLIEFKPRYLIIDEVEKMDGRDMAVLLSLMETGMVTRLKKGMKETVTLKTWVFAGANKVGNLPEELKSRFFQAKITEYTEDQLRQIAHAILSQEGYDPNLIDHAVTQTLQYSRDIRDVLQVVRLSGRKEDVPKVVELLG